MLSCFKRHILITGGAGFIGAHFCLYFVHKYPDYLCINLDQLTYAADLSHLQTIAHANNYIFVKGDINDRSLVTTLFQQYHIDTVVHFAAESHVDNSIANPEIFIQTNIAGTFTLLDIARHFWLEKPQHLKADYSHALFYHVSTDEVYGTLGTNGYFTENSSYQPRSPYSASKASADLLVSAYSHTYGLPSLISHCSNNYGPYQHTEKLIPTIIHKALQGQPIPIYGNGQNIRDWLYVEDHIRAIDVILHKGQVGDTYNIGGSQESTNLMMAQTILQLLDRQYPRYDQQSYTSLITFVPDRPGHDFRYAIDHSKLSTQLGWYPQENLQTGLQKTIDWYLAQF
jgi:dTDP-glucose 4,6-dehydratase